MFWEKYTELCKSVGKSPNAVAEECGIKSTGSVTGWKKGAIPRNPVLKRIADYFHVPITYFYVDSNIENYVSSSLSDAVSLSANGQKNKPVITKDNGLKDQYEEIKQIFAELTDENVGSLKDYALYLLQRQKSQGGQ